MRLAFYFVIANEVRKYLFIFVKMMFFGNIKFRIKSRPGAIKNGVNRRVVNEVGNVSL